MSLLDVQNLSIFFKGDSSTDTIAVDNISFSLDENEVLGIVGESGSGKSVTSLSIVGLLPYPKAYHSPSSSIKFNDLELCNASDKTLQNIRGNDISFIFQEPMSSLNPLHTIEKQIIEAIQTHQPTNYSAARKKAIELLTQTGIKNARERLKSYPYELSGGQRQRVMIAMAITNNPKILIADEPTTALDVTVQAQILDLLLKLKKTHKMSIIFISHDLGVIRKIADKVCVMKEGKIIEHGTVKEVFTNPKQSYTKTLTSSSFELKNNKKTKNTSALKVDKISVTYPLEKNFWGRVTKQLKAVNSISFELKTNETIGIVGESGSGKTTLGMAVANLIKHQGTVNLKSDSEKDFRKSLQIVFQDPYNSLNPRMTIKQIVAEGLEAHFSNLTTAEKQSRVIKTLQNVGLSGDILNKYPHEFSGGQRQRIAIARALILEPKILILDEPTSALDVTIQKQVIELLSKIQQDYNISYIFISHDINVIKAVSDRIMVMKDGKIIEINDAKHIIEHPKEQYTKELINASL